MKTLYRIAIRALALALCPLAAHAVTLSPNGIGQALVYPYYTVNKDQDTLISVTNASAVGKAVQIRFLEGYNGREVLAFALFLSPFDVWTAAISQTSDDGGAVLHTSDRSCTFPNIGAGGATFVSGNYDGGSGLPADAGPQGIARTREGSIEIIAGGDIVPGTATATAVDHVQNGNPDQGQPPGCATLGEANLGADLAAPTEGLYGSAFIVNVGQGTLFAYDADALADFTATTLYDIPNGVAPTLDRASSNDGSGAVAANVIDEDGHPIVLHYAQGIDAVSAVFMAAAIRNEYVIDASLGANTDWIVTFPTKRYYVDRDLFPDAPRAPFVAAFDSPGTSPITYAYRVFDREEGAPEQEGCGFICPGSDPAQLDYEVTALTFLGPGTIAGTPSGVFGSRLTFNFRTYPESVPLAPAGWVEILLDGGDGGHLLPSGTDSNGAEIALNGLPVTGFMAYNIINTQAQPGMLANYGGTFRHRSVFSCADAAGVCAPINTN